MNRWSLISCSIRCAVVAAVTIFTGVPWSGCAFYFSYMALRIADWIDFETWKPTPTITGHDSPPVEHVLRPPPSQAPPLREGIEKRGGNNQVPTRPKPNTPPRPQRPVRPQPRVIAEDECPPRWRS